MALRKGGGLITVDAPALKRICANIDLFLDKKARYLGDRALVEIDSTGLTLTASDDYAIGRDSVPALNGEHRAVRVELSGDSVTDLAKLAGDQGSAVAQDQGKRGMVGVAVWGGSLVVSAGGGQHSYPAPAPTPERAARWKQAVDCLADEVETGPMPRAIAFRPVRLWRMSRVKGGTSDDPIDVRILPLECDVALVRVGETFRGALMLLDRETLRSKYSDHAASYLWT